MSMDQSSCLDAVRVTKWCLFVLVPQVRQVSHELTQVTNESEKCNKAQITSFFYALNYEPLHPNISMYILHTVLCTFLKLLDKEDLFNNQEPL